MIQKKNVFARAVLVFTAVLGPTAMPAHAQTNSEIQSLKKEIEALKANQKDIQKNVQIIKDILMGKQPPLENVFISTEGAPSVGEATAKLTMVEFSDFQCPFCGRYANQTMSQVLDTYVKTGRVRYVFRNFPLEQLHPNAEKAAEAANCAGEQNKFWEAHDRFFKNQSALDSKEMLGHATVLGLDVPKFQQCLDSGKYTAKVKADEAEGQKFGVKGTPTFFFGTVDPKDPTKIHAVKLLSGAVPFDSFKDVIEGLLNPPKLESESSGQ
jgi:protein-disulfide isomerase